MVEKIKVRFKPTYIPRLMPIGGIVILLMMLLPQLREKGPARRPPISVEPPLAMKMYDTGYAKTDSLLNAGLRYFSEKRYEDAARVLSKVHFYWSAAIREKRFSSYPEDLLFYLGLAHFYRGYPKLAAPLLEEGEQANPFDNKYPWYLAHVYLAERRPDEARGEFEKVVKLGGAHSDEAREKIAALSARPDSLRAK
jgi:tetratricopeptide (TPR) repeat protein